MKSIKIIFVIPILSILFFSNAAYAQYPSGNQQATQTDESRLVAYKQNIAADAKIDVDRVAKVIHDLSASQKTQLQNEYVIIEKQKYANNLSGNPNKLDPDVLDKRMAAEKGEALKRVLTPKQLATWDKVKTNKTIGKP